MYNVFCEYGVVSVHCTWNGLLTTDETVEFINTFPHRIFLSLVEMFGSQKTFKNQTQRNFDFEEPVKVAIVPSSLFFLLFLLPQNLLCGCPLFLEQ